MMRGLDWLAARFPVAGMKRNPAPIRARDFVSLALLFAPPVLFAVALLMAGCLDPRFGWLWRGQLPWQLYVMALSGALATLGGMGDWLYHRVYVAVGPKEHDSHVAALAWGGLLFFWMCGCSISHSRPSWVVPIVVTLMVTLVLICHDEFSFHSRRCKPCENLMHHTLTFGNGLAFLCWLHWLYA